MVRFDEFVPKGKTEGIPMIVLSKNENDKYPFQFGQSKAKLIVENYEAIKRFAKEGVFELDDDLNDDTDTTGDEDEDF